MGYFTKGAAAVTKAPDIAELVGRLHERNDTIWPDTLWLEAATALERQSARLESAEELLRQSDKLAAEAQATIERFRGALENIAAKRWPAGGWCADVARGALEPGERQ